MSNNNNNGMTKANDFDFFLYETTYKSKRVLDSKNNSAARAWSVAFRHENGPDRIQYKEVNATESVKLVYVPPRWVTIPINNDG